ncbi:MAG: glycosyltransferase family 2 protein [bacterium]|nr:glycosyltransferase family 2 protein [bacterium]
MHNCLYIVVPCYNEQDVLLETAMQLREKVLRLVSDKKVSRDSKIVFVNDGSKDSTWDLICQLHKQDKIFIGIDLSRNRGHQNALLAGLMAVRGSADMVISIDADLQDDINAMDEMIKKYNEGCDIVYGVRNSRKHDSFLKRFSAEGYYRFMNFIGVEMVFNHADYRLMSRRALEALSQFNEVNLFLRGIIPMIGYKSDVVYYERSKRLAGESKYPARKMLSLAFQGITSLSIKPIRMITILGVVMFLFSIAMFIYTLIRFFGGFTVTGWSSLIVSVWAIGGLVMLSIGVVGEYIGKIYLETKGRPKFIIKEILKSEEQDDNR